MEKEIATALKDELRTKFEGASDAVLDRVIRNRFDKTISAMDQVKGAVEGLSLQAIIESYGDSRATEAQATAIRNYESKYGLKDGVKTKIDEHLPKAEPNKTDIPADTPAWAKGLLETNKALTERLAKLEGKQMKEERGKRLSDVIGKLPENLQKAYSRIPIEGTSDEEFEKTLQEISEEVKEVQKVLVAKGVVFGRPTANNRNVNAEELTKEQIKALSKTSQIKKDEDAQPF